MKSPVKGIVFYSLATLTFCIAIAAVSARPASAACPPGALMTQNSMDVLAGTPVPGTGTTTVCLAPGKTDVLKAPATILAKNGTYSFLFWDTNGEIRNRLKASFPTPKVAAFTSTAWYQFSGKCMAGPCGGNSNIYAIGFQLDKNQKLAGTPIASVTPATNSWKAPSNEVFTNTAVGITAGNPLDFVYWHLYPKNTTITTKGTLLDAAMGDTAFAIAFYGPNPCQYIINEGQSLSPADFPAPSADKLYAAALRANAAELRACEAEHGGSPLP
ncbi:MAG: hypothetical protein JO347_00585 [Candidatus Eremiobacteraeota bacterium]|nr:hypothetical protein [Candidatus Eremiobacteraeota bacterium]